MRNIAWSITLLDVLDEFGANLVVQLRDEVTGLPLWRSGVLSGGVNSVGGKNGRK